MVLSLTLQRVILEDKNDLENSVVQRKIKIPKLTLSKLEDPDDLNNCEEAELRHKVLLQRPDGRKNEGARRSIEAVLARLEKQNGKVLNSSSAEDTFMEASETNSVDTMDDAVVPRVLYEELLRSYQQQQEEMRHIQKELERTRRQLVQQAKKLKEYGTLVSEVKELRELNRRLQDVLLLRLGNDCIGPVGEPEVCKSEPVESQSDLKESRIEEANTSTYYPIPLALMEKYTIENGKVHLGSNIWVDQDKWYQLQLTQGDSKFTKNLAVMIWGTDVLKNRSVTGVATKKKKDAVAKPPLSPHKLSVVRAECVYDRISQETVDETEIAQRVSKVNKYICEKIMDINKSLKNEERKELKYSVK
uniref:BEN domain containing 5 n=1 Tax=Latimeria chalumnae TaxID=7897 RepID=H3AW29_LATCH